jgi:hypothetical protein
MPNDMTESRLRAIEVAQAEVLTLLRALSSKMDEQIKEGDDWRHKVERILYGDGNGYKGHNVRLDRLEQAHDRSRRFFWGLLVPVILLALKALSDYLPGS